MVGFLTAIINLVGSYPANLEDDAHLCNMRGFRMQEQIWVDLVLIRRELLHRYLALE